MRQFHHIGIPVQEKTSDMVFYESIKCWATDPDATPGRIEYIFFEEDTTIAEPVLSTPHVAFRVDDLDEELKGKECAFGPIKLPEGVEVAFFYVDGCLTEFHQVIE
jgi:predicted enzyme related to lactoylglutathione lyase